MKSLYIDNFRGFETTFLELSEVNFFVGENSTGKTSIIKLIGILSSPGFWNYNVFNNNMIDLGGFEDIVSTVNSKSFFDIAIMHEENGINALKLRFIEENNSPVLKEIYSATENFNVQISIEGKFLKYKYAIENIFSKDKNQAESFKYWVQKNGLQSAKLKSEEVEFIGLKSILFQMLSIIQKEQKEKTNLSYLFQIPAFQNNLAWTAPVRAEPKKTYDTFNFSFQPDGSHAPYTLNKLLNEDNDLKEILKRFGTDSGLYEDLEINLLRKNFLHPDILKPDSPNPFELIITLDNKRINIVHVGYGVSQILPVLIEVLGRPNGTWFTIQQPETHLHPRAQAAFGDFLYKANFLDKQKFIIETHSDYLIDRFRLRLKRNHNRLNSNIPSKIFFFSRKKTGNQVDCISLNSDGTYPDEQPKGFRDFFIREQLDLLSV